MGSGRRGPWGWASPVRLVASGWVTVFLFLLCCAPPTGATVIVFTVFDVFAELESWGRATVGRFNASTSSATGTGSWPVPEMTARNSQTVEIAEVRLLDAHGQWVKSHRFDSSARNFAVSPWESERYYGGLRAHARRIETIRLGELSGQLNMAVYVLTESGHLDHTDVNVTRGDVQLVLEFENVTDGCGDCRELEAVVSFWGRSATHMRSSSSSSSLSTSGVTELLMLPSGAQIWLPNTVLADDNLTELAPQSPSFEQWDTALMVTLRMPVFRTSAAYSATVRVGGESRAHLLEARPAHRIYADDHSTTTLPDAAQTTANDAWTKAPGAAQDRPRGVVNPEYRHVSDNDAKRPGGGASDRSSGADRRAAGHFTTIASMLALVLTFVL